MSSDDTVIANLGDIDQHEEKKPYLAFIKGSRLGEICELASQKELTVGRSPDCDIWVEDSAISRKHFTLKVSAQGVTLTDLGSTNGTYVNGQRVRQVELADGDKIQISQNTILELTYLDETRSLSEKQRYEMGVMDPVTNVYNKRYFIDRIQEEVAFAQRRARHLSLIMIDIDHFKLVNDRYGHLAGDLVLQKVGGLLNDAIRSDDILSRYGGEEFVLILRDTQVGQARELAERLRQIIESTPIAHQEQSIKVTVSAGVAALTMQVNDYVSLIAEADRLLYRSKKQGRNRVSSAGEG